jgi:hypothetical protein
VPTEFNHAVAGEFLVELFGVQNGRVFFYVTGFFQFVQPVAGGGQGKIYVPAYFF